MVTFTLPTRDTLSDSIPLADDAPETVDAIRRYLSAVRELVQAVNAGTITEAHRAELGGQLLAESDALTEYAIRVLR